VVRANSRDRIYVVSAIAGRYVSSPFSSRQATRKS
jgi:hypothetical protein